MTLLKTIPALPKLEPSSIFHSHTCTNYHSSFTSTYSSPSPSLITIGTSLTQALTMIHQSRLITQHTHSSLSSHHSPPSPSLLILSPLNPCVLFDHDFMGFHKLFHKPKMSCIPWLPSLSRYGQKYIFLDDLPSFRNHQNNRHYLVTHYSQ